ncbi:MAG TPA: HPr(Ser) kinase/phosphatase [Candidatus Cloacimonas sp.]|jgi:HPr kinase/phosphorylase|nr:HPr(Ser) kinase/phosphatase [Candidatus Cloacimonas sp.]
MKTMQLKTLFHEMKDEFSLNLLTKQSTLEKNISNPYINRPGLALAGYFERFSYDRVQILGETEISYLQSLKPEKLYDRIKEVLTYDIPAVFITKGLSVPDQVVFLANEMKIPIITTRITTNKFYYLLGKYLDEIFAPTKTIHGTLVELFGVGILLTGKSGIGKSECALDLVERGRRLIADDAVKIVLRDDVLMGTSTNDYGHFMEVRGVGLIDVERMFGIHAVRVQKRIDVQVELMPWRDNLDYERIGLTDNIVDILGKKIPIIYLPVSPGKNISVVIEVIAMNYILKTYGYEAAKEYTARLQQDLKNKAKMRKMRMDDKE